MGVSIKLCYHPSVIKGKDGTLYYQIIIKRTTHTYTSGYRIYPNDWDKRHGRILTNSSSLIKIKNRTYWEMQQIYSIAKRHIDKGTPLDFGGIISEFEELNRQQSFSGFLLSQAERLADMGRTRTSETYISALHSFIKFNSDEDIMLYEITAEVMEDYERYLKNRNLTMNSISFYMRTLRTVLNKAVKLHLVESSTPFQSVYTGIAQTVKRAIDIDSIKRIKEVDLGLYPHLAYARDIFLLSLSLRGMSFIDMAYLTYDNLRGGYLSIIAERQVVGWISAGSNRCRVSSINILKIHGTYCPYSRMVPMTGKPTRNYPNASIAIEAGRRNSSVTDTLDYVCGAP